LKKITLGFSPCPNDTYIFDALVNSRIDTGDYIFEPVLKDVEELNRMAREGLLDVTKISVGAYAAVSMNYIILDAGSALGKGVGPLIVSGHPSADLNHPKTTIAIPGKYTTANLLLSVFYPQLTLKKEALFSDIESMVSDGSVDLGLLIHEGRFTYASKGLFRQADLGEVWEKAMDMPLPLGCIGASRKMHQEDAQNISHLIHESILFARNHPSEGKDYIKAHAQEMDDTVIDNHISLYVNDFSLTLGREGQKAIEFLLVKGAEAGLLPETTKPIFIDPIP
jgi:1,4-dihydroxy-6-naphthoate synthase